MLDNKAVKPASITYSRSSGGVQRARVDVWTVLLLLLLLLRRSIAYLNGLHTIRFQTCRYENPTKNENHCILLFNEKHEDRLHQYRPGSHLARSGTRIGSCSSAGNSGLLTTQSLAGCSSREAVTGGRK